MHESLKRKTVLGVVSGAALAAGTWFSPQVTAAPEAVTPSNPELTNVGPNLSGFPLTNAANEQLQTMLTETGPTSCLAYEIATILGVPLAEEAQVVTPTNIWLVGEEKVKSAKYNGEIACQGQTPIEIANSEQTSEGYRLMAIQLPDASSKYVRKTAEGYVAKHAVIRGIGENALIAEGSMSFPKQLVSNSIDVNVSYGVHAAVSQYDNQYINMLLNTPIPTCPPGSTTTYQESSNDIAGKINDVESSEAQVESQQFVISGENVDFADFESMYTMRVVSAKYGVGDNDGVVLACAPPSS